MRENMATCTVPFMCMANDNMSEDEVNTAFEKMLVRPEFENNNNKTNKKKVESCWMKNS